MTNATSRSDSIVAHRTSRRPKRTAPSSIPLMLLSQHRHIVLCVSRAGGCCLGRAEVVDRGGMACITLAEFGHEIAIEHGLPHLNLLPTSIHLIRSTVVACGSKATYSGLVEYLILIALAINIGQHIVNS